MSSIHEAQANQLGPELEATSTRGKLEALPASSQPRSTYTDMAIDAFRKQEQAKRRLARAEDVALKAARLVPKAELPVWFEETEKIRMEMDARDEAEFQRTGQPYEW